MIAQKLTLRISPPKLPSPGTAPVAANNLKFSGNMSKFVFQTEASRRSRSPTSDGKRAWVMYVCMYVCMYVYLYVFHIYLTIYSAY